MKRELVEILACPICKSELDLDVTVEEDEIREGVLRCEACSEDYPIRDGIPNLLPPGLRHK